MRKKVHDNTIERGRLCFALRAFLYAMSLRALSTQGKNPMKITVLAHYFCSMFIFVCVSYCRIVKNKVLGMKFYILLCKLYHATRQFFTDGSNLMESRSKIIVLASFVVGSFGQNSEYPSFNCYR